MQPAIPEKPRIEWIILADAAEVLNGKVYMLGGGWDRVPASQQEREIRLFAIAMSIVVPWHQTNERHGLEVKMTDADGQRVLFRVAGEFESGRPPGAVRGQLLRTPMAFKFAGPLSQVGTYAVAGSIDGEESCRTVFHVHPPLSPPPAQPPQNPPG